jgi:CRP/FNR family cyclic AMP-dependent transcriptional regulator
LDLFWSLPDSRDFAGLSSPLDELFGTAQSRKYDSGASVSDPEVAPERAFRCVSGTIKVTKLLASGREILITILQTGSVWSDRAVLNGYWRDVFVEAMEPSEIVSVDAVAFERVVRSSPELLAKFMLRISEQVSDALTLLDDFRGRDVASRLARVLVRFSKQYGVPTERGVRIELPVTHQDLANMIGTARETVSRNMARFRQQGYVKDGHAATLEILNLDSLEALIV